MQRSKEVFFASPSQVTLRCLISIWMQFCSNYLTWRSRFSTQIQNDPWRRVWGHRRALSTPVGVFNTTQNLHIGNPSLKKCGGTFFATISEPGVIVDMRPLSVLRRTRLEMVYQCNHISQIINREKFFSLPSFPPTFRLYTLKRVFSRDFQQISKL